jgi:uncharacterized protein HemY
LRADIHNFLAQLEIEHGNWEKAENHILAAFADADCDGNPYCYVPAIKQAQHLQAQIQRDHTAKGKQA